MSIVADIELRSNPRQGNIGVPPQFVPDDIPYEANIAYDPQIDELKVEFDYGNSREPKKALGVGDCHSEITLGRNTNRLYSFVIQNFVSDLRTENIRGHIRDYLRSKDDRKSRRKSQNIRLVYTLFEQVVKIAYPTSKRLRNTSI